MGVVFGCGREVAAALSAAERASVLTLINTRPTPKCQSARSGLANWTRAATCARGRRCIGSRVRWGSAVNAAARQSNPAKVRPELLADGPSQVWRWDVTKLRGPAEGIFYQLYVLIGIYSRFNPA